MNRVLGCFHKKLFFFLNTKSCFFSPFIIIMIRVLEIYDSFFFLQIKALQATQVPARISYQTSLACLTRFIVIFPSDFFFPFYLNQIGKKSKHEEQILN